MSDRRDIEELQGAFDAAEQDARALVAGLGEELGRWRDTPGSWSVAQCLDHLATANRVYLRAMQPAAQRAIEAGRQRRRAARPGVIGGWFVRSLEPPVNPRFRGKAPASIQPRPSPALREAFDAFLASEGSSSLPEDYRPITGRQSRVVDEDRVSERCA